MSLPQGVEMSHLILKRFVSPGDFVLDATCGNGHDTVFLAGLVGDEGRVLAVDIQQEAVSKTRSLLEEKNLSSRARVIKGDHSKIKELIGKELTGKMDKDYGKTTKENKRMDKERIDKDNIDNKDNKDNIDKAVDNEENKDKKANKTEKETDKEFSRKKVIKAAIFNLGFLPGSEKELITTAETTLPALKQSLELIRAGGVLVIVAYTGHQGGKEECQQVLDWAGGLNYQDYNVLHHKFINQPTDPPQIIAAEKRI